MYKLTVTNKKTNISTYIRVENSEYLEQGSQQLISKVLKNLHTIETKNNTPAFGFEDFLGTYAPFALLTECKNGDTWEKFCEMEVESTDVLVVRPEYCFKKRESVD